MTSDFPFKSQPSAAELEGELADALRDCAKHRVAALRRIHDLMAPRLLAEFLQMLGDRKLAEAALVDCHVEIWQKAGDFNPQRSQAHAWLLSIARHHAIELLRTNQGESPDEVDSALSMLQVALHYEGMPPQQRVLQLAWRSGRSPVEIARALQMPLRHVQQEIRRSLDLLAGDPP